MYHGLNMMQVMLLWSPRPHMLHSLAEVYGIGLRIASAVQGSVTDCAHASKVHGQSRVEGCSNASMIRVNLQVGAHAGVGLAAGVAAIAASI